MWKINAFKIINPYGLQMSTKNKDILRELFSFSFLQAIDLEISFSYLAKITVFSATIHLLYTIENIARFILDKRKVCFLINWIYVAIHYQNVWCIVLKIENQKGIISLTQISFDEKTVDDTFSYIVVHGVRT